MKQGKLTLKENHRRSLTSALTMVEQMLAEMKDYLDVPKNYCCFEVDNDINDNDKDYNLEIIGNARKQICKLAEKYDITKHHQSLSKAINAKKTRIWEILCDVKSRRQKGFGEFPKEMIKEYDSDIEELMDITNRIIF
jgi:hypothetical protein